VPGRERSNILWKFAELMEAHASELSAIEALNNGIIALSLEPF
jgi:acyl-CoA reductase-like NAD-dependent aldehyde dehydrogenase